MMIHRFVIGSSRLIGITEVPATLYAYRLVYARMALQPNCTGFCDVALPRLAGTLLLLVEAVSSGIGD